MLARLSGFLVWALVAASVAFWGLRLFVKGPPAPANALPVAESMAVRGDLTRLFGQPAPPVEVAAAPAPGLASRFRLFGVMAPKTAVGAQATSGLALIAVDGKPARPYPVGTVIDGDLVLQSVSLRTAAIGPSSGAPAVTLELAPPLPAATGRPMALGAPPPPVLRRPAAFGAAAPMPPPAPAPFAAPPAAVALPANVAAPGVPSGVPGAASDAGPNVPAVRRDRGLATQ